jgi:hypothetical protein
MQCQQFFITIKQLSDRALSYLDSSPEQFFMNLRDTALLLIA